MDAEAINNSTDVQALQARHKELLVFVDRVRNNQGSPMTEVQCVAEKILIKQRLRALGATVKPEARLSTVQSKQLAQNVSLDPKGAN